MMRAVFVSIAALALLASTSPAERGTRLARPASAAEYGYGSHPKQRLYFWNVPSDARAPLVIFVHGGGWKNGDKSNATGLEKIRFMKEQGYAFASINYRLLPEAAVEEQAVDVAASVAWLRRNAGRLGFDPDRIVLSGHSAGAHLVALVGTDPTYLRSVGMDVQQLRGVVPIDGAAYDVPAQMRDGPRIMQKTYGEAFGSDPGRQRALSPVFHAAGPNTPAFLLINVQREDGLQQAKALASALRQAGTSVQINEVSGRGLAGHIAVNRRLGAPDYPATPVFSDWLKRTFR